MVKIKQLLNNDMIITMSAFAFVLVGLMLANIFLTFP
jgi:hypothetical protein